EVAVFNVRGERVRTLERGALPAGAHRATWDGLDAEGRSAASGVYFVRISAESKHDETTLVLIR
ncbi:MAG: hypothetical protein GF405_11225, partial [Candidatus Eisenbacteria bacterium]|nr:hypothetical protein [Candidatus Eisenbacteria bacterium]